MNQNKLVSVCINAYNSEKYIAETLNSVINQSYKNLQIIVVDDASTDATAEVVRGINDPRIELYTLEKNGHISNANNETYLKVRGEYMVHTDSDDILNPDLIEKTVGYLESHPECGGCFCRLTTIDENGNDVQDSYVENVFKVTAKTQAEFVRLFFDSLNHLSHTGATMRKSVIDDIGFHDLSLCYLHDFDYWTRLVIKYPIHVIDEYLAKYRRITDSEHNSSLNDTKMIAHNTEFTRIIYRMIENCPDQLFLEAFSDKLKLQGPHTHEEVNLEKAFLLQEGLIAVNMSQNKILSISMLAKLFEDKNYVELARDKFQFSIRDYYALQTTAAFYDESIIDEKNRQISSLETNVEELNKHISDLDKYIADFKAHITELNSVIDKNQKDIAYYVDLVNHKQAEIDVKDSVIEHKQAEINAKDAIIEQKLLEINQKDSIIQHKQKLLNRTVEYRMAKLFKKLLAMLKHSYHFCCLRDRNGKKYRKSVMVYGYYAINLGDDMFLEKLITRYPDTMFFVYSVYFCEEYRAFFERFDNVKFYSTEDSFVQRVNKIGQKFKINDLFELLLLKRSSATVHIGGSIYQQVGDYNLDYKIRRRRKQPFKPFYSISCNFGPHQTQEFMAKWSKQFKKFKDICFRDKYSYNLFSSFKNVRYAPDVLFSHKCENASEQSGSVAISVYNPFSPGRNLPPQISESYLDAMIKTVCDLVSHGKKVTLLGFCAFEGDGVFLHDLIERLPEDARLKIEAINYTLQTKEQTLNALSSAEYVIGTRLHSVILGIAMNKKVLPIVYSKKTDYILNDMGFDQPVIKIEEIENYKDTGFARLLNEIKPFNAAEYKALAENQFAKLDSFLK